MYPFANARFCGRTVALTLMGFGGAGIISCLFIEDIGPKMNRRIEVFLENDVEAHMNKCR